VRWSGGPPGALDRTNSFLQIANFARIDLAYKATIETHAQYSVGVIKSGKFRSI
jgi:hypothetical protein